MAYESNFMSLVGNLTDDPELRFTPNGAAVCNFRMAVNRRWTDRDGKQQEETTFVNVNAWRSLGENVAESLKKGDRAVVLGRLRIRSYEDREGQTRWITEVEADEIAPSLRFARAQIDKGERPQAATSSRDAGDEPAGAPPPDMEDVPF